MHSGVHFGSLWFPMFFVFSTFSIFLQSFTYIAKITKLSYSIRLKIIKNIRIRFRHVNETSLYFWQISRGTSMERHSSTPNYENYVCQDIAVCVVKRDNRTDSSSSSKQLLRNFTFIGIKKILSDVSRKKRIIQ